MKNKKITIYMITEAKILDNVDKMPRLPTTVSKVIEIGNNINASPSDLMQVIKFDPVLTAKVLKLINSAYFGLPQKVTSLTRAVILLGINTIKNLALSTSVMSTIQLKSNLPNFDIDRFWEHSLACAVVSKMLAGKVGIPKKLLEEYFITGLMHDIGKILFVQCFSSEYEEVLNACKANNTTHLEEENNIFGITHPKAGALVCKKWELHQDLTDSVEQHHCIEFKGENIVQKMIINVADTYCSINGYGVNSSGTFELDFEAIEENMKLTHDQFDAALLALPEEIEKAKVFLQAGE